LTELGQSTLTFWQQLTLSLPNSALLIGVAIVAFILGWLIARLSATRKLATLEAMLEYEIKSSEERIAGMEKSFGALSANALRENNQSFMHLAGEVLGQFYTKADEGLKTREQAIDGLVKPLKQALSETNQQLHALDKNQQHSQGELTGQIKMMSHANVLLHSETRNLAKALRRPELRGQWGELTLKRLVELSGMVEHVDFETQTTVDTPEGRLRPDMIVNLPNSRQIVVDVKAPLDAYLDAFNAEGDETKKHLVRHAQQVKDRIKELALKQYWAQFEQSPDFVVLFIPGDQFLSAALEEQTDLLDFAMAKKVILATPTSLVALLRVIAYGWHQSELDEQTQQVRKLAQDFETRIEAFARHISDIGNHLDKANLSYNRAVGSYQRKLRPISRKFALFAADQDKDSIALKEIDNPSGDDKPQPN
jgi:DNA recombination protein RmuC